MSPLTAVIGVLVLTLAAASIHPLLGLFVFLGALVIAFRRWLRR